MAADTRKETISPPETVTITLPGEAVIELYAMLEAFAVVTAELSGGPRDDAIDAVFKLQSGARRPLDQALWASFPDEAGNMVGWIEDAMWARHHELADEIRALLRGDALRIAALEDAVQALADVVGVVWKDDAGKWLTPSDYFAAGETTEKGQHGRP